MHKGLFACTIIPALLCATPAVSGVYSDDLSKCLVAKTNDTDKVVFMRWIFAIFSASSIVKDMSSVTTAQRDDIDVKAGRLFERLLVKDCHAETVAGLKYEGESALTAAFSVLGQVGGRGLMQDPDAAAEAGKLANAIDPGTFAQLAKEAGLPTETPKK